MKSFNLKQRKQVLPYAQRPANLGERNRNPLNIRYNPANKWLGLSPTTPNVKGFCCFTHVAYGYRAAIILMHTYYNIYKCVTPEQIIYRWAPPIENDTELYIACVCGRADVQRDQPLDLKSSAFNRFVAAMARQESGALINEAEIQALRDQFGV
ncbi:MAG: structural protein P5 [Bacteroidaceae bacterium]|nr:structural protein P5 [Bacteroidaceae bacterium]